MADKDGYSDEEFNPESPTKSTNQKFQSSMKSQSIIDEVEAENKKLLAPAM